MTSHRAYLVDLDFKLLVDGWVEDKRCPMPLVDRCLELGMTTQADCARWAATEIDRPRTVAESEWCGPYPTSAGWCYWLSSNLWMEDYAEFPDGSLDQTGCYVVPRGNLRWDVGHHTNRFDSTLDAVLWLMEIWVVDSSQESQVRHETGHTG